MIPRHQRVLFWVLLAASIAMAVFLIRLRERAQDRMLAAADSAPLSATPASPEETITLLLANDSDGSLAAQERKFPLPVETNARARVLLQKLLSVYAEPKSTHPLMEGTGVDEVFLRALPGNAGQSGGGQGGGGQLAIVNLSNTFTGNHPSGIEVETLTLLSMIGTLHANIPAITQVRFLVDGQPHETLAGHADLTRVYLATDSMPTVNSAGGH